MKTLHYLLITARPKQWIKNCIIFIPLFFSGKMFFPEKFLHVIKAIIIFCLLSSAVYLLNDYKDRKKDKLHPNKKNRPLASGKLKPEIAIGTYFILGIIALISAAVLSEYFFAICLTYFLLLSSYSLFFRDILILDGMLVAMGFVLRVFAGALVIAEPISSWIVLCTIATALLIAFGRRRCEITILNHKASSHRKTLNLYPEKFIDTIITSATAFTLMSYTLFTFFNPIIQTNETIITWLPNYWINPKWLMLTIPITMYGVFRYLYLIYEKETASSPEEAIFGDYPLLASIAIWLGSIFLLIYIF